MVSPICAPSRPATPVVGLSVGAGNAGPWKGGLDGIGVYTEALLAHLPASGVTPRRVDSRPLFRESVRQGMRPIDLRFKVPLPVAVALGSITGTRTVGARNVSRSIDLYHSTDYMVPRLAHTPVVATVYDAIPIARPEWANPRLRRLKNWLLVQSIRNADRVIAISEAAREEVIAHYHIPADRTRVIPLGVDDSWFAPIEADAAAITLRDNNLVPGYFLFVGTLQPRKNVGMLLDAYDRLPPKLRAERQLVIVGKSGWNTSELRMRLEDQRSRGRCIWLDHVPRETLRHLYSRAGALVFPSLAEGFGLPVLEALALGLPVIASDLPALREVGADQVMYLTPADETALIDGMVEVGKASPNDSEVSKRRMHHAARFSWRVCAKRTVDVYRELWTT